MTETKTASFNALGFFEHVALRGLEGKEFRMSYAKQREFFGYVPFGKKRIIVDDSKVTTIWKTSFGTDWESMTFYWSQAEQQWRDLRGHLVGHAKFHI